MKIGISRFGEPRYRTRNGSTAVVMERHDSPDGDGGMICFWRGRCDSIGGLSAWCEWNDVGECRDGPVGFDIIGLGG